MAARTLTAFNTATASENKIHADDVASKFGFTGGLVPGVDVFAYLAQAPAARWGRGWLSEGAIAARFLKPVYDGDEARIEETEEGADRIALSAHARGDLCATGHALRIATPGDTAPLAAGVLPERGARPKASFESLPVGKALGPLTETYWADVGRAHIEATRADPALYEDGLIANPAYLLRRANYVLAQNVRLGPWIHVESDARLHGLVHDGDPFETRAEVRANEESKGHLIVTLAFTITARGNLAMSGKHVAIYEPRQVRERG